MVRSAFSTGTTSSVTVKWTKVSGASGYAIYRKNNKTGKYEKIATVSASKLSYKNTGLKKKTTYSYKVRAYKTYEGTTNYGSYSPVTKIKTK